MKGQGHVCALCDCAVGARLGKGSLSIYDLTLHVACLLFMLCFEDASSYIPSREERLIIMQQVFWWAIERRMRRQLHTGRQAVQYTSMWTQIEHNFDVDH